jgi:hypothetical protein
VLNSDYFQIIFSEPMPPICIGCGVSTDLRVDRRSRSGVVIITMRVPMCEECHGRLRQGNFWRTVALVSGAWAGLAGLIGFMSIRGNLREMLLFILVPLAIAVGLGVLCVVALRRVPPNSDPARAVASDGHTTEVVNVSPEFKKAVLALRKQQQLRDDLRRAKEAEDFERGLLGPNE